MFMFIDICKVDSLSSDSAFELFLITQFICTTYKCSSPVGMLPLLMLWLAGISIALQHL